MTKPRHEILTQDDLKLLLKYNRKTGELTWKKRKPYQFKANANQKRSCNVWNGRFAGKTAFTAISVNGYRSGSIHGKLYLAHRVIICLVTGEWPPEYTDHINGIKTDNSWENIKPATRSETMRNAKMYSSNESGMTGVYWSKAEQCYRARITDPNGKNLLKRFRTVGDAVLQRGVWQRDFGYSDRHGLEE